MALFYLIRHATNDLVGKAIAGRGQGIHLNEPGREQAERLAEKLANCGITRIFSSPLERAQETAAPLARILNLKIHILEAIQEIDFAGWTGRTFAELQQDADWRRWNSFRLGARVPDGETILEVQARMVGAIRQLWQKFPNETIAVVSHGDPIHTIIYYYLGVSMDFVHRVEISPASYTVLKLEEWSPQILALNVTV